MLQRKHAGKAINYQAPVQEYMNKNKANEQRGVAHAANHTNNESSLFLDKITSSDQ